MPGFAPAPRRTTKSPVRPGSLHLALGLFAPVLPAPRVADRPHSAPRPALRVPPACLPVEVPAAPAPAPRVERLGDGVFRVEVLSPGELGWGFPVRESVVGPAPSARVARLDAASSDARPVAVWALTGSDEVLVWGAAA